MFNIFPVPILLCFGACLGALLRWQLSLWLNTIWSVSALGVLLANWLGCFLIGICAGLSLNDANKLLIITGFLGSFTTFSSFSIEVVEKIATQKYLEALAVLSLHILGGLLLTGFGLLLIRFLRA